jgi:hypothetical protein
MIDPKAVEAARRIVAAADRFNKCRAEFPIEKDWDFDACSEWEDALHSACIEHGEILARALLTASQARDEIVEEAATKADNHLKDWANELSITHGLYIDAKSTGRFNGRAIRQEMADIYAAQFRERSDAVFEAAEHTAKAIRSLKTGERERADG